MRARCIHTVMCAKAGKFPQISGRQFYLLAVLRASAQLTQYRQMILFSSPKRWKFNLGTLQSLIRTSQQVPWIIPSTLNLFLCLFFDALGCHKGNSICLHSAGCKRLKYGRMTFPNLSTAKHKSVRFDSIKQKNVLCFNLAAMTH